MKKLKNTIPNRINLIYLTKFYLFNKDVGSLNFFFINLKNIAQVKKSQGYIRSLLTALEVCNETLSGISSTALIPLGIIFSSVLFCGLKFLFKNQTINEVDTISSIIPIPENNTALQFVAKNFQTTDYLTV